MAITVKLSDREADTLASLCEKYSEDNACGFVFRGRKRYKFTSAEFYFLEQKLRGKHVKEAV